MKCLYKHEVNKISLSFFPGFFRSAFIREKIN